MQNELAVQGSGASTWQFEEGEAASLKPGRLDFGALESAATGGRPRHPQLEACRWCDPTSSVRGWCIKASEVAEMFEVDVRTLARWRAHGVTVRQADYLAVRVGLLPDLVWGPRWDGLEG